MRLVAAISIILLLVINVFLSAWDLGHDMGYKEGRADAIFKGDIKFKCKNPNHRFS